MKIELSTCLPEMSCEVKIGHYVSGIVFGTTYVILLLTSGTALTSASACHTSDMEYYLLACVSFGFGLGES
jgi:hypothetical protein